MVKMSELDFGYEVEITNGKNRGERAFALYPVSGIWVALVSDPESRNYNLREKPGDLEIISRKNKYNIFPRDKTLSFR